mmetsp:Transcript_52781/g.107245  ORF Transcript_52781/g.107245 Transcript_52781/m.107245 type:complete len:240 (+) Transcript_52781:280-999(+)
MYDTNSPQWTFPSLFLSICAKTFTTAKLSLSDCTLLGKSTLLMSFNCKNPRLLTSVLWKTSRKACAFMALRLDRRSGKSGSSPPMSKVKVDMVVSIFLSLRSGSEFWSGEEPLALYFASSSLCWSIDAVASLIFISAASPRSAKLKMKSTNSLGCILWSLFVSILAKSLSTSSLVSVGQSLLSTCHSSSCLMKPSLLRSYFWKMFLIFSASASAASGPDVELPAPMGSKAALLTLMSNS